MAAPAFKFQYSSPLDSLVRRTSSRKVQIPNNPVKPSPVPLQSNFQHLQSESFHYQAGSPSLGQPQRLVPASPLLHSHFARDSIATESSNDNSSRLNSTRTSIDSRNVDHELEDRYYDDESIYSDNTGPALRDSWQSAPASVTRHTGDVISIVDHTHAFEIPTITSSSSLLPTVLVSPPTGLDIKPELISNVGRMPIVRPIASNFSRPVRPSMVELTTDEQKRKVLERNTRHTPSPNGPRQRSDQCSNVPFGSGRTPPPTVSTPEQSASSLSMRSGARPETCISSTFGQIPLVLSPSVPPSSSCIPTIADVNSQIFNAPAEPVSLPNHPPSLRLDSPVSLYSTYSFYQLDSPTPSPTGGGSGGEFHIPLRAPPGADSRHQAKPSSPSLSSPLLEAHSEPYLTTQTPQEYLQLGIQHHEANRLKESAVCFEKSAKENGGCGVGMLMWGLALRHGWGCDKNEKLGFKWLSRAAESAVEGLENARGEGGMDPHAVQTELVLAIYEVGQCFFQGWGVAKDRKMAVSYYKVAAGLGDADSQSDLAFCLANGKGCKKNRREAARWYRAAVAQGQSDIGLAWIYKDKYQ